MQWYHHMKTLKSCLLLVRESLKEKKEKKCYITWGIAYSSTITVEVSAILDLNRAYCLWIAENMCRNEGVISWHMVGQLDDTWGLWRHERLTDDKEQVAVLTRKTTLVVYTIARPLTSPSVRCRDSKLYSYLLVSSLDYSWWHWRLNEDALIYMTQEGRELGSTITTMTNGHLVA